MKKRLRLDDKKHLIKGWPNKVDWLLFDEEEGTTEEESLTWNEMTSLYGSFLDFSGWI